MLLKNLWGYKMILEPNRTIVVILNMQLQIIPLLDNGQSLLMDCVWLSDVTKTLKIPTLVIEHKKLGKGSVQLKEMSDHVKYLEKYYFDFTKHDDIKSAFHDSARDQIVLAGCESHVCLLQSAFGLRDMDKKVFILKDTCSARNTSDHVAALDRLKMEGFPLITREMFFFEMIKQSEYPEYQQTALKYLDGRYIR